MAMLPGYNHKVRMAGTVWVSETVDIDDSAADLPTPNSEGAGAPIPTPGYETGVFGHKVVNITLSNCSFDPADNPFLAPRLLASGIFIALQIWPAGLGGNSWNFPSARVISVRHMMDSNRLQPLTIRLKSNGPYSWPST